MFFRTLVLILLSLFALFGYISYLNHETQVTLLLFKGKPLTVTLPVVMVISFAAGAFVVFMTALIHDLVQTWREFRRGRSSKKEVSVHLDVGRGLTSLVKGDMDRAGIHLANVLKKDPTNLDIYVHLSTIHAARGDQPKALELLEKAWAIDPENEEILFKKAELYDQMGNPGMAIDTLEKILAVDQNNLAVLSNLRDVHREQQNWKEALRVQKRIVENRRNKDNGSKERDIYLGVKYEYAQALEKMGDEQSLAKAAKLCRELIKMDAKFQPAYVLLGRVYEKQQRWVEAGRTLGRGFRASKSALFLMGLEDLYLRRDDRKTLMRIYRRTLEKNPDNMTISLCYARLCLQLNMLDEAMDELVELRELREEMAIVHGLMAEVFSRKGQLEASLREYQKAAAFAGFFQLTFVCRSCRRKSVEWVARCPHCEQWNTYVLEGEERQSSD